MAGEEAGMTMSAVLRRRLRGLDGRWRVERLGGMLPPMVGVSKEIRGGRGKVWLGPLPGPSFRVENRGEVIALVYRPPLSALTDELEAASKNSWVGQTLFGGYALGRFQMTRVGC